MGLLNNSIFYEAGSIDRSPDGGRTWRKEITPRLQEFGIRVIDPTDKPPIIGYHNEGKEWVGRKKRLRELGRYEELAELMHSVRNTDLRCIDHSSAIICNFDLTQSPVGTIEELSESNRQKKPALIRFVQGVRNAPDWLFGMYHRDYKEFFYDEFEPMFEYLTRINNGDKNVSSRWVLFS